MTKERELPEAVFCQHCNNGRAFHHLAGHLHSVHGTNQEEYRREFGMHDDEPLFSRQYSQNRSIAANALNNIRRATILCLKSADLKKQTVDLLASQELYTTGQAARIKGVTRSTMVRAVREDRLQAGIASLISSVEEGGEWRTIRLPGVPQALIEKADLETYTPTEPEEQIIHFFRKQSEKALASQDMYTTGQASEITGLGPSTFQRARKEGRLLAGKACLINFMEEEGQLRCIKMPGIPQLVIQKDDLVDFVKTQRTEVQNRTAQTIPYD